MSIFVWIASAVCSFLLTYLVHSTVIIGIVALVVRSVKRFQQPLLRTLAWKLAVLLPVFTTTLLTVFPDSHFGVQIPLMKQEAASLASTERELTNQSNHVAVEPQFLLSESEMAQPELDPASTAPSFLPSNTTPEVSQISILSLQNALMLATGLWGMAVCIGVVRLISQMLRLRSLRLNSPSCSHAYAHEAMKALCVKMGVRQHVELVEASEISGAFTAGIWRPFIAVPIQDGPPLCKAEWEALLAHELAHIVHRDAAWNLLVQVVKRIFPFQLLNRFARRQLQIAMDFAADESAVTMIGEGRGLVQCLLLMGDRMLERNSSFSQWGLVAGMVAFRSTLGQRVERLLDTSECGPITRTNDKVKALACLTMIAVTVAVLSPQAVLEKRIQLSQESLLSHQVGTMKSQLSTFAILLGLTVPVSAEETPQATPAQAVALKSTPDELPAGIRNFNGMLVGRLAAKDVEKGSFVVVVDAVPRVWRNSRAENPKSIVGKSIQIEGVFGKFLDVLVTTRIGETIEFECKHAEDALMFPGELLRKVAPYKAEDYPVLPEDFRGFRGSVVADIKKKDPETFELIIEVQKVQEVWKESAAKNPESIVGKSMMLAGFWNRKETYHDLKVGSRIEVGMQHIGRQSDHLTVAEFVRSGDKLSMDRMRLDERGGEGMKREGKVQGFRGILVGRLVQKDVERGTFTATVDAVARVWENSEFPNPKSLIGRNVDLHDVPPKMLDALVVTRIGETLQFAALHDGEDQLRVGEVLRKVAPVETGDYPELPDAFRGFRGVLNGKIVKKDQQLWDMTVEVTDVVKSFEKDRSQNAASIVGKSVMLSGFWNKQEAYHDVSVGDKIQFGVEHPQKLSDHLNVIEGVRKLED